MHYTVTICFGFVAQYVSEPIMHQIGAQRSEHLHPMLIYQRTKGVNQELHPFDCGFFSTSDIEHFCLDVCNCCRMISSMKNCLENVQCVLISVCRAGCYIFLNESTNDCSDCYTRIASRRRESRLVVVQFLEDPFDTGRSLWNLR